MVHKEIFEIFKQRFPKDSEDVNTWFPNGKNSIRIRMTNEKDYVFTFNGAKDWRFESINSFLSRNERRPKM